MNKIKLPKKKVRTVHRLRSDTKIKTLEYQKNLNSMYGRYIKLPPDTIYAGPHECLDHLCLFCGETSSAKPSTMVPTTKGLDEEGKTVYRLDTFGRGCVVCRTNSDHIAELQQYEAELERVHNKKFSFAFLPQRFVVNSGKYRQTFKCNDCGVQHYQTPQAMLNPEFKCANCVAKNRQGTRTRLYQDRLNEIYGEKINIVGKYHDSDFMHHSCDKHHNWLSMAGDMLCGAGCKRCKSAVSVDKFSVEYRNQKFMVRKKLEARGIRVMATKITSYSGIRTSLDFPIPILYGKKSPAFFHPSTGVIADVIKLEDFKKFVTKKKFSKSKERATELGMDYGVILVGTKKAAGLWTMNWLTGKDELPENWDFDTLQLGNGNVRAPVLEI